MFVNANELVASSRYADKAGLLDYATLNVNISIVPNKNSTRCKKMQLGHFLWYTHELIFLGNEIGSKDSPRLFR